ncbi:MAG: F-type H+-transporting ATPase subunit b [Clostridiales bacterium]|nr:F-type H+-transporting ATPase subunit b [Clostridiales bacterium]
MIGLLSTLEEVDRLFGLDAQLLADATIELLAIFVLFVGMSYLLFNPAREFLKKRQDKIREEMEQTAKNKEEAALLKAQYTKKMDIVDKEAEQILSDSRKVALKKEADIVQDAKEEAARIIDRANKEVELEKNKAKEEVKQEMIVIASMMAGKIASASMDEEKQAELIENTLQEMGDKTWQN